jgi:hypothetical protein
MLALNASVHYRIAMSQEDLQKTSLKDTQNSEALFT